MFATLREVIMDNFWVLVALLLLSIVVGFLIVNNLESEDVLKEMVVNKQQQKTVTRVTSGVIESGEKIAVEFSKPQIKQDYVNYPIQNNGIFNFTPDLAGQTYWQDTKTIVFEPQQKLTDAKNYTGFINLNKLFPQIEQLEPTKQSIEFRTLGQRLLSWQGEFELVGNSGTEAQFKAQFEFAEEISKEKINAALDFKGLEQELDWELKTTDNKRFKLESTVLSRKEEDVKFKVQFAKEKLNLPQQIEKEYILAAHGPLRVIDVEEQKVGNSSNIRLIFSDYLAQDLNYGAYLSVEPQMDYDVIVDGRVLILDGDFKPEQKYRLKIFKGLKGKLGSTLATTKNIDVTVKISDIEPKIRFAQSGMFLTTAKKQKIAFQTMNVERVTAKLKKVNTNNLVEFFERNSYRPQSYSYHKYNERSFQWAGKVVDVKKLKIGDTRNRWITSQLDLSDELENSSPGLYIVQLEFDEDDTLYLPPEWNNYQAARYIRKNAQLTKHIIKSDLGVTAKQTKDKTYIFVTDVLTTEPVANAVVKLKNDYDDHSGDNKADDDNDDGDYGDNDGDNYDDYNYPDEVVETAVTDENGVCVLEGRADYLEVKKGAQWSLLEFDATKLDTSLFDTSGVNNEQGLKAFIYNDRGVYRPGDKINLSVIVRNENDTFPDNHPLTLKVYNPQKKLVHETTKRQAEDGFYSFNFATKDTALTGEWKVKVEVGSQSFFAELNVESIVPYRIETEIKPEQEQLTLEDKQLNFTLGADYLFGAPASGLDTKTKIKVESYPVDFAKFNNFVFTNQGQYFAPISSKEFKVSLNQAGETDISWELPEIKNPPAALRVNIQSKVLEKGGRPVPAQKQIPIKTYDRYVGIRKLEDNDLAIGNQANFDIALVNQNGELISGEKLKYKIYRMRRYWWWEYDDRESFRRHFKSDNYTEVVDQGVLTSRSDLATIEHQLKDYGELLLEVEDLKGGHKAAYFFRSYWWGDEGKTKSADITTLELNQAQYSPGDTAKIAVDTPEQGQALLTIEKNGEILQQEWQEITGTKTIFEVAIKEEHIPNAYAAVSVYQPQENNNDLPIRMYGIEPLIVNPQDVSLDYQVQVPTEIKPKEKFKVKIKTADKKSSQFTIAVVDEGLLDITNFKTPNPLEYFFQKERLITKTFDTFSDIIGLNSGYIYNVFSIGGGRSKKYKEKQLQAEETDRFEPVALFKGPIKTDGQGQAEVEFEMPNYIGNVRVMVIGARQGSYGQVTKNIPVKSDLMVMPTLPRVLGPQDKITVPVTVFGMAEDLENVEVSMEVQGAAAVQGKKVKELQFNGAENKDLEFDLAAAEEIGKATIKFKAVDKSNNYQSEKEVELAVRPYNPYIYKGLDKIVAAGEQVVLPVPEKGIENSNYAGVSLSKHRSINLKHRLQWLIRYPYGCIEQTTSSVFPQLYLGNLLDLDSERIAEIDKNINSAMQRLRKFQLANGGFAYWPTSNKVTLWGTNYAGHFLIAAQKQGYSVPKDMLQQWLEYQQDQSRDKEGRRLTRAYRLYLLALADQTMVSEMNYMRENELGQMRATAKVFLAGAYQQAGYQDIAQKLIAGLDFDIPEYRETGGTYGSSLRDKAIILDLLTEFERYDLALGLYNDIAEQLSSEEWYSTQSTAYSLLAATKYLDALEAEDKTIKAEIITAAGMKKEIESKEKIATAAVLDSYGSEVVVKNKTKQPLFATLEWEGIPLRGEIKAEEKNLALQVEWLDEAGQKINPTELKQGTTFWGHFEVDKTVDKALNEVALVQILPAGWEIENIRLSGDKLPEWMNSYDLNQEEYLDIRDDRVRWFFDMKKYEDDYEFVVKINTVTVGEFYLPPTLVEAMYDNRYKATTAGQRVKVLKR
ncbi:MAG: alpha-2-macroglobulin family protein [Bacillota bacterium]